VQQTYRSGSYALGGDVMGWDRTGKATAVRENVTISYRGAHYEIGRGPHFYGIWAGGAQHAQPLEWWPETPIGWSSAWARFTGIEAPGTIVAVAAPPPPVRQDAPPASPATPATSLGPAGPPASPATPPDGQPVQPVSASPSPAPAGAAFAGAAPDTAAGSQDADTTVPPGQDAQVSQADQDVHASQSDQEARPADQAVQEAPVTGLASQDAQPTVLVGQPVVPAGHPDAQAGHPDAQTIYPGAQTTYPPDPSRPPPPPRRAGGPDRLGWPAGSSRSGRPPCSRQAC
jgi:hypothetical protein